MEDYKINIKMTEIQEVKKSTEREQRKTKTKQKQIIWCHRSRDISLCKSWVYHSILTATAIKNTFHM